MLEELGTPYKLAMLPFPPRVSARSYLDVNPLGTVPLMIDGQTRMTESAAICQYLCARSAPTLLQVEPGEEDFGRLPQLPSFRRGDTHVSADTRAALLTL